MVSNVIKYLILSTTKVLRRVKVKRRLIVYDRVTIEFLGQKDGIFGCQD